MNWKRQLFHIVFHTRRLDITVEGVKAILEVHLQRRCFCLSLKRYARTSPPLVILSGVPPQWIALAGMNWLTPWIAFGIKGQFNSWNRQISIHEAARLQFMTACSQFIKILLSHRRLTAGRTTSAGVEWVCATFIVSTNSFYLCGQRRADNGGQLLGLCTPILSARTTPYPVGEGLAPPVSNGMHKHHRCSLFSSSTTCVVPLPRWGRLFVCAAGSTRWRRMGLRISI